MRHVTVHFFFLAVLCFSNSAYAMLLGHRFGIDNATNFSILTQHGPILATHPDNLNGVSPSTFWKYEIRFDNTEKPGVFDPNDSVDIEGTITHVKSPPRHRDGAGVPLPFTLSLNADNHNQFGRVTGKTPALRKHGNRGHFNLLKAAATASVFSPPSPIPGVDSATDEITAYNLEVKVIHTVSKPAVSNGIGGPRAGSNGSPNMSFDSDLGLLSFTDTIIDFANLVGDTSMDESLTDDPIIGATISVTDLAMRGSRGDGFLFTDGMLSVTNNNQTLLRGEIPELLIDDSFIEEFGSNIFAPILISEADLTASPFMDAYTEFLFGHPGRPPELFGLTSFPVADLIGAGQSFNTVVQGFSFATSVPEPPITAVFLVSLAGVMFVRSRNNQRWAMWHVRSERTVQESSK